VLAADAEDAGDHLVAQHIQRPLAIHPRLRAAEGLQAHLPVRLDARHNAADLVLMGHDTQRRGVGLALDEADDVARLILPDSRANALKLVQTRLLHLALLARRRVGQQEAFE